ncbi:MAG: hypothetical protein JXR03_17530 [Cyclobacteriaceae bacterium]
MIRLIAEHKENGYGIVDEQGFMFLIKQPFVNDNRLLIDKHDIDKALEMGFDEIEKEFENYVALEKHLNKIVRDFKRSVGVELSSYNETDLFEYFQTLPEELIELQIDLLEENDDHGYVRFVTKALKKNPLFSSITIESKEKLEALVRKLISITVSKFEEIRLNFPCLDKNEFEARKDFSLGLQVNNKHGAAA